MERTILQGVGDVLFNSRWEIFDVCIGEPGIFELTDIETESRNHRLEASEAHLHVRPSDAYLVVAAIADKEVINRGLDSTTTSSLVKLVSPSLKGAESGTFWLWVRSQATAESFPIYFSRLRRRASCRLHPPLPLSPLVLLPQHFLAALFPLSYTFECPAVTADLSAVRRLALRAFLSAGLRVLPPFTSV